ncbi:MAG: hypothetical protein K6A15_06505 [Treponema sp.]|nr:hypothetical protein [Treponema sp.]
MKTNQLGLIMLDIQWNAMEEGNGLAELAKPMYDKKMWDDDGAVIQPPTFRAVTDIVLDIVGTVTTQKWIGFMDDLLFAATDLTGGYKTAEEVGLELGKKALVTAVGFGIGAAGKAASTAASSAITGTAANVAAQAGISTAQSYATSVASNAINSVYIGKDGLAFDGDGFGRSLYSADTIGGMVGAGVTAGLSEWNLGARSKEIITEDGKKVTQTDFTRARGLNETQIGNISRLNSLAGGLAGNAVTLAMGGNASFNILNVSDIVSMFGGEYRNGKTGAKASTGLFEVSFGKDGVTGRIGMNGTDISLGNLMYAMDGALAADKSSKINRKVTNERVANAMRSLYGFGENIEKTLLEDLLNGDAILESGGTDGKAQTVLGEDGKRHIYLNINDDTDWKEMGLMLSHEAHRDGLKGSADEQNKETVSAVKGHTEMAKRMMSDSLYYYDMNDLISGNQNLQMDLIASTLGDEIFEKYVNGTYDSSDDYWRMTWGGQLINDGQGWLIDENGWYINADGTHSPDRQDNSLGANGIETGLLNIIAGTSGQAYSSFSDEQIKAAQALMTGADKPMEPSNPDANFREFDWSQNLSGQKIDMTSFMKTAGANVNQEIFKTYYNNTVDSQISKMLGVDLGFDTGKEIPKNQYGNYTALFGNALIEYLKSGDAKQTLNDKYFQTLTNEQGESTKLYKLDKNNPFLDELLGQHDLKGVNPSIDSDGCNFMSQLAVPQLLTGKIIKDTDIIDSIWKEANKNGSVLKDSKVEKPETLSDIVMKKLNLNLSTSLGYKKYTNMIEIASRKTINYDKYIKNGETNYHTHFVLSDLYGNTIYNPGYKSTGDLYNYTDFYLRGTK